MLKNEKFMKIKDFKRIFSEIAYLYAIFLLFPCIGERRFQKVCSFYVLIKIFTEK